LIDKSTRRTIFAIAITRWKLLLRPY